MRGRKPEGVRELDIAAGRHSPVRSMRQKQFGGSTPSSPSLARKPLCAPGARMVGYRPAPRPQATIIRHVGAASAARRQALLVAKARSTRIARAARPEPKRIASPVRSRRDHARTRRPPSRDRRPAVRPVAKSSPSLHRGSVGAAARTQRGARARALRRRRPLLEQ